MKVARHTICTDHELRVYDFGVAVIFRRIKILKDDLPTVNVMFSSNPDVPVSYTLTGCALGSFSSASDFESSIEVGTIGRSTTTLCAFIESRKIASMAP